MKVTDDDKYCLSYKIHILWIDKIFGLAKVLFVEEEKERIIGLDLITDKPYEENTLRLDILAGRIQ